MPEKDERKGEKERKQNDTILKYILTQEKTISCMCTGGVSLKDEYAGLV